MLKGPTLKEVLERKYCCHNKTQFPVLIDVKIVSAVLCGMAYFPLYNLFYTNVTSLQAWWYTIDIYMENI